jgi:hypothetical protein
MANQDRGDHSRLPVQGPPALVAHWFVNEIECGPADRVPTGSTSV